MASDTPPLRRAARHAAAYLLLAAVLWLWPFFLAGWKGRAYPALPGTVTFQYSAAGFFTKRAERWWDHHVELRLADGGWVEMDERSVFPMGAFGHRTRLDRILNETHRSPLDGRIRARIAGHIAGKLALGTVDGIDPGSVAEIRLVRSVWPVGEPGMARPAGRWSPPPSTTLPRERRWVLGTWRCAGGRAVPAAGVRRSRTEAPPPRDSPARRRIVLPPPGGKGASAPDAPERPQ